MATWAYQCRPCSGSSDLWLVARERVDELPAGVTILRVKTGLRFPMVLNLNATLQYNVDWQNNPPVGFDSTDSSYIVSLGYLW